MTNTWTSSLWLFLLLFPLFSISQPNPTFQPIPSSFAINSANPIYALDINYDSIDLNRQGFHLFLPDSAGPYPLVIYIHGGGFTGGSRDVVISDPARSADVKYFLDQGIAYASIGYRLIATGQPDPDGVIKCLSDAKRALQFIRHYAPQLYVNPEKIVLRGNSAGAGTSLWLATHPDMADPDSPDPVLRASTRVCAVQTSGSQSTYDLHKWESEVYHDFDGQGTSFTADSMVNILGFERFSNFYGGFDSIDQVLHDPALIQYRQEVDMLSLMTNDDPPLYIENTAPANQHPRDNLFHHALHAQVMQEYALAANLPEVKTIISAFGVNTTQGESTNEFLLRHINACSPSTGISRQEIESSRVLLYPNPATAHVSLQWPEEEITEVSVFSLAGSLIQQQQDVPSTEMRLSTASLAPGMYVLSIINRKGQKVSKKLLIE